MGLASGPMGSLMGGPAFATVCPRQIAESSVVEITLSGLGMGLKININEEGHANLMEGTYR